LSESRHGEEIRDELGNRAGKAGAVALGGRGAGGDLLLATLFHLKQGASEQNRAIATARRRLSDWRASGIR
jgi:hypothetical protein